jgi:hypothetical protein
MSEYPTHCRCGRPVQDPSQAGHRCSQCAEHCEIARYERECRAQGVIPAYADTGGRPSVSGDPG